MCFISNSILLIYFHVFNFINFNFFISILIFYFYCIINFLFFILFIFLHPTLSIQHVNFDCFCSSMTSDNLIFKRAAVWVYGIPKCHPTTSSGCNARIGYCTCNHGYFGAACEYQCPHGRYGRNCKNTCQCKNGALVGGKYLAIMYCSMHIWINTLLDWRNAFVNILDCCIGGMQVVT